MGILEIILIGVSLSMDAFAVSICSGLKMRKINYKTATLIAVFFGGFQGIMPTLGYFLGKICSSYVSKYGHWIAFALLVIIGGKMIFDVIKGGDDEDKLGEKVNLKELFLLAIATSIDAFAVGVTFGLNGTNIVKSALIICLTTFIISFGGVIIGHLFGAKWKNKAQVAGGIILILVGVKILLEGLGVINLSF